MKIFCIIPPPTRRHRGPMVQTSSLVHNSPLNPPGPDFPFNLGHLLATLWDGFGNRSQLRLVHFDRCKRSHDTCSTLSHHVMGGRYPLYIISCINLMSRHHHYNDVVANLPPLLLSILFTLFTHQTLDVRCNNCVKREERDVE